MKYKVVSAYDIADPERKIETEIVNKVGDELVSLFETFDKIVLGHGNLEITVTEVEDEL